MKVFIWFLCSFVYALIITFINITGITLGGIPTVILAVGTMWLAKTLCKKWDRHKESKAMKKKVSDTHVIDDEQIVDDMTPDEALHTMLKMQGEETVRAMEANSQAQPNNESDVDFGLVPKKPIFTLAMKSVDGEKEYLNKLYTADGEKIKYNRRGSMSVDGINGMIDIYDIYLPSGQLYKTIYINMYGAKKSTKAPAGFILNNSAMHFRTVLKKEKCVKTKYCSRCGSAIDNKTKVCTGCGKQYFRGLRFNKFSVTVMILSFVIVAVSTLCVMQYVNTQKREEINKSTITRLEKQVYNKQSTITRLKRQAENNQSTITSLEKEIDDLKKEKLSNEIKLNFFDSQAALINVGSKKYHNYGCEDFDSSSSFYIFNINAAEKMGYYACSKCKRRLKLP